MSGFANVHPFFVHAPLVFVPAAALLVWLGRRTPSEGFFRATLLVTFAAALGAWGALASGLVAAASLATGANGATLGELIGQHQIQGIVLTSITTAASVVALAEWRGWIGRRAWWVRGALLTWASLGVLATGHSGATLVYQHGAGVVAAAVAKNSH